jgi:hypothetical protein
MARRDTHPSQPQDLILYHNVGQNWLIPGINGSSATAPDARNNRLVGAALAAANAARAANLTRTTYTHRIDGTYELPTDALAIAAMSSSFGGVGLVNATVFRDTLLLTQIAQAQCVRVEMEHYRRHQSSCTDEGSDGVGCTMGSLFWMGNDLWPAATKGGLEWSGKWKVLHHYASHSYAPYLVSAFYRPSNVAPVDTSPVMFYLSVHPPAVQVGAAQPQMLLSISCYAWASGHLGDMSVPFTLQPWTSAAGGAQLIYNVSSLQSLLDGCGCSAAAGLGPEDCVVTYSVGAGAAPSAGSIVASNWLYPAPFTQVRGMKDPQLTITDVVPAPAPAAPGSFAVTIAASGGVPAATVFVESLYCCGHFSDNAFLMTQSSVTLVYTPAPDPRGWAWASNVTADASNITAGQFAASLSIWSLYDTASY